MGLSFADILYFLIAVSVVMSIHESSHAIAAYFLGDPTAKIHGRISLNPMKHFDMLGFLLLVFVHFGWGKPVPVNPSNFKHPMRDSALTALAGPVSNFLIAFVVALPLRYLSEYMPSVVLAQLWWIFDLAIIWGIFNMFPIPPLDGGKILGLFVPRKYSAAYMQFQDKGLIWLGAFILLDMFVIWGVIGLVVPAVRGFTIVGWLVMNAYEVVRTVILYGV